jgi:hypothetical protein
MLDITIGYNMALAVTRSIGKTEFRKMDTHARLEILRFIDDSISLTYGSNKDVKKWREPFEKKYADLNSIHEELKQKMIKG